MDNISDILIGTGQRVEYLILHVLKIKGYCFKFFPLPLSHLNMQSDLPLYTYGVYVPLDPRIKILTQLRRFSIFSPFPKELFFRPLIISNTSTPKLQTSDFTENCPCIAYSGDIYPLHIHNYFQQYLLAIHVVSFGTT